MNGDQMFLSTSNMKDTMEVKWAVSVGITNEPIELMCIPVPLAILT
jgi:hypothetical protein